MTPIKLSDSILTVKVKYIPEKDWLAISCGQTGKVYLFDLADRLLITHLVGHNSAPIYLYYLEASNTLASVYADSCVKVWDLSAVQKKKPLEALLTSKHNALSIACEASVDNEKQTVFIVNSTKRVMRTDLQTGRVLNSIDLAAEDGLRVVASVEVLLDPNTIAVGCKLTGNVALVVS